VQNGQIGFADGVVLLELAAQREIGALGARDHHDAAGLTVETVDDARAFPAADLRQFGVMRTKKVRQGAVRMAGRGMDEKSGRFVDDQEFRIGDQNVRFLLRESRARRFPPSV
jgi:hypothetical protein